MPGKPFQTLQKPSIKIGSIDIFSTLLTKENERSLIAVERNGIRSRMSLLLMKTALFIF